MKGGLILIAIGVIFLLRQFGFIGIIEWDIIWPVALIIIGLNMIMKRRHCINCGITHDGVCTPKQ